MANPPERPLPDLHVLPAPLPHAGAVSPCQANACRACCMDTRMPLLPGDIERLSAATGRAAHTFTVHDEDEADGPPRLLNVDGACVFLGPTGCTVYPDRPAGCRLYPLVLDPDTRQGVLDPDCPYTRGFRVRPRDRAALGTLIDALGLDPASA